MSWISSLFKGKIDAGKLVTDVSKGIDVLSFTKEERAQYNEKQAHNLAQFVKDTLSENTTRSKARRFIAIALICNAIALSWFCIILSLKGIPCKFIIDIFIDIFGSTSIVMILGFFFGGYYLKNIAINKKKD
jgi:hypothetical protein